MNRLLRRFSMTCLLTAGLSGCVAHTHTPAPVSSLNKDYSIVERGSYQGSYYEVKKGDTLYFIAYVTDRDVNELARYNDLPQPYTIFPGQKLKLWAPKYVAPIFGNKVEPVVTPVIARTSPPVSKPPIAVTPSYSSKSATVKPVNTTTNVAKQPPPKTVEQSKPKEYVGTKGNQNVKSKAPVAVANTVKPQASATTTKPVKAQAPVAKPPVAKTSTVKAPVAKAPVAKAPEAKPPVVKAPVATAKNDNVSKWLWPTKGRVISNFSAGEQGNKGIDIAGQRGQSIVSTASGTVVYSGNALRGYGNLIIVKHNDNYLSAYAHNDKLLVSEGQNVKGGQKIATMGSTGSKSVKLHFEIRYQGKSVNPKRYLP